MHTSSGEHATRGKTARGRMPSGQPNPIDVHVGTRIRQRRALLGMSQGNLATALGLTFQQVQKYERGANRVGSSRLFDLSRVLDVPISYFFDGMSENVTQYSPRMIISGLTKEPVHEHVADPMNKRETLELVRAYYRIKDGRVRKSLFELVRLLSRGG